ncbi:MAG: alpha/beta hydrolase [Blastocatellia bacterium]|nr:MAG: alpha/beta hydrolase [Blastocatellia bacterium]
MPLREIAGPAGRLEALLDESVDSAAGLRAAVVFAHPHPQYGGTMHTKVVYQAAKALSRIGCAVLRFNFRGVGASAGHFDDGVGERNDFCSALDFMHQRHPAAPLWAGGFSFGSWIALTAGATDPRVSTLIGIAPPIGNYDFESVRRSPKPKFFIQGERDELCPLKQMESFYAQCEEPKELVVIDAANHLFDGKSTEVGDALEDLLADWSE